MTQAERNELRKLGTHRTAYLDSTGAVLRQRTNKSRTEVVKRREGGIGVLPWEPAGPWEVVEPAAPQVPEPGATPTHWGVRKGIGNSFILAMIERDGVLYFRSIRASEYVISRFQDGYKLYDCREWAKVKAHNGKTVLVPREGLRDGSQKQEPKDIGE